MPQPLRGQARKDWIARGRGGQAGPPNQGPVPPNYTNVGGNAYTPPPNVTPPGGAPQMSDPMQAPGGDLSIPPGEGPPALVAGQGQQTGNYDTTGNIPQATPQMSDPMQAPPPAAGPGRAPLRGQARQFWNTLGRPNQVQGAGMNFNANDVFGRLQSMRGRYG